MSSDLREQKTPILRLSSGTSRGCLRCLSCRTLRTGAGAEFHCGVELPAGPRRQGGLRVEDEPMRRAAGAVVDGVAEQAASPGGLGARGEEGAVHLRGGQARNLVALEVVELVRVAEADIGRNFLPTLFDRRLLPGRGSPRSRPGRASLLNKRRESPAPRTIATCFAASSRKNETSSIG